MTAFIAAPIVVLALGVGLVIAGFRVRASNAHPGWLAADGQVTAYVPGLRPHTLAAIAALFAPSAARRARLVGAPAYGCDPPAWPRPRQSPRGPGG